MPVVAYWSAGDWVLIMPVVEYWLCLWLGTEFIGG